MSMLSYQYTILHHLIFDKRDRVSEKCINWTVWTKRWYVHTINNPSHYLTNTNTHKNINISFMRIFKTMSWQLCKQFQFYQFWNGRGAYERSHRIRCVNIVKLNVKETKLQKFSKNLTLHNRFEKDFIWMFIVGHLTGGFIVQNFMPAPKTNLLPSKQNYKVSLTHLPKKHRRKITSPYFGQPYN